MSCYVINYQDGAKVARPVFSPQEFLVWRDSVKQKELVAQARGLSPNLHFETSQKPPQGEGRLLTPDEAKKKLVQFCYSCIPNEDGTLKGAKRVGNSVGMDVDHIDPDQLQEVIARVLAKKVELGLLMMELSARGQGIHIVFKRHPEMTNEENLKWASELLGIEYDKGAKDITRVFFASTASAEDLLYLDEELFDNTAVDPLTPYRGDKNGDEGKDSDVSTLPLEGERGEGLPFDIIVPTLCKLIEPTFPNVAEGLRNNTLFELAADVRYICEFNEAKLKAVLYPKYTFGLPESEVDSTLRSALMRERYRMPKRLREILEKVMTPSSLPLNGEGGMENSGLSPYNSNYSLPNEVIGRAGGGSSPFPYPSLASSIIDESVMPKLPKWLETLLVPVPAGYRFVSLVCLSPALMTLMTGVTKKFGTKKVGRLNGWSHLDGPMASGKGMLDSIIYPALHVLQEQDDRNQELINEAILQRDLDKNKEDQKKIPQLPIRILPPDTTRKQHIRLMMQAGDKHTYTYSPELGSMNTHGTGYYNRRDFERLCFDNSFVGSQTAMDDTPNLRTRCNWNVTTASTRDQTLVHWKNVTDGAVTRVFYCFMPDNTFLDMPDYKQHTEEQLAYIDRASTIMMKMQGLVLTPRLDKALQEWLTVIRKECEATRNRVRADLRKRTADIAHTFGVVIHLAHVVQEILDKEDSLNEELSVKNEELTKVKEDVSSTCEQIAEAERAVIAAREALETWKKNALDLSQYREARSATEMGTYAADYCLDTQYALWGKKIHSQLTAAYADCDFNPEKKSDNTLTLLPNEFTVKDVMDLMPERTKGSIQKMIERFINARVVEKIGTQSGKAVYAKVA